VCCLGLALCGCRGAPNESEPITIYVPYIESVDAPHSARVGEEIVVRIVYSTNVRQGLLEDPSMGWWLCGGGTSHSQALNFYVATDKDLPFQYAPDPLVETNPEDPPGTQIMWRRTFSASEVGEYTYTIGSTRTREAGGTPVITSSVMPSYWAGDPPDYAGNADFTSRKVVINVLP
jgi:hypothetical protein